MVEVQHCTPYGTLADDSEDVSQDRWQKHCKAHAELRKKERAKASAEKRRAKQSLKRAKEVAVQKERDNASVVAVVKEKFDTNTGRMLILRMNDGSMVERPASAYPQLAAQLAVSGCRQRAHTRQQRDTPSTYS